VRVLVIDAYYREFLRYYYGARPELAGRPYEFQWRTLMDAFFGTGDAYSHYMRGLGHEAHEVVWNCEPLQLAWAREHGFRRVPHLRRVLGRWWRHDLLVAQADWLQADVVYVQDPAAFPPEILRRLKRRGRRLVGQIASELPPRDRLEPYDLVVSSLPRLVGALRAHGVESEELRLGFDPRVLARLGEELPSTQAAFVGSLRRRRHGMGNMVLERAAVGAPLDFWGYGEDEWPADSPIRRRYRGAAWGSRCTACSPAHGSPSTATSTSQVTRRTTCASTRRRAWGHC
jgi:spore maturation protein CgeB